MQQASKGEQKLDSPRLTKGTFWPKDVFLALDTRGPEFNPKSPPVLKQAVWDLALMSLGTNKEGHIERAWDLEPSGWGPLRAWVCWIRVSLRHRQGSPRGTGLRVQSSPDHPQTPRSHQQELPLTSVTSIH